MVKFNKFVFILLTSFIIFGISNAKAADWSCSYVDTNGNANLGRVSYTIEITDSKISNVTVSDGGLGQTKISENNINDKYLDVKKSFIDTNGKTICPAKIYYSYCYEETNYNRFFEILLSTSEAKDSNLNKDIKRCRKGKNKLKAFNLTINNAGGSGLDEKTGTIGSAEAKEDVKLDVSNVPNGGCGFIGPNTLEIIEWIIKIIRIVIPALVILLGVVDFATAMFSGEDKTFRECGIKFIKRLVAAILLIFLPYILSFLINLTGIAGDYNINPDNMFCAFF